MNTRITRGNVSLFCYGIYYTSNYSNYDNGDDGVKLLRYEERNAERHI